MIEMTLQSDRLVGDKAIDAIAEGLVYVPGGAARRAELLDDWKREARRSAHEAGIGGPKVYAAIDQYLERIASRVAELLLHGGGIPPWPEGPERLN